MKKSLTEFIEGLLGAGTLSVEGSCGKNACGTSKTQTNT